VFKNRTGRVYDFISLDLGKVQEVRYEVAELVVKAKSFIHQAKYY
jgi:hypothetical protein